MGSKAPLYDAPNRSSAEVEELLPCAEHTPDPRDFYASDSPVLDEYLDPDQDLNESEPEVQVESSSIYHV
jgi:hypothetical protein